MILRAILVWLDLMVVAIANGAVRERLITPRFGARAGHIVSTILLCAAVVVIARLSMGWIGAHGAADGWQVGAVWLTLTLAFEFLAGHYLFAAPWSKLLADYNVAKGRIWVLVPIVTLTAPRWAATAIR